MPCVVWFTLYNQQVGQEVEVEYLHVEGDDLVARKARLTLADRAEVSFKKGSRGVVE
jgi:hypothetical protein